MKRRAGQEGQRHLLQQHHRRVARSWHVALSSRAHHPKQRPLEEPHGEERVRVNVAILEELGGRSATTATAAASTRRGSSTRHANRRGRRVDLRRVVSTNLAKALQRTLSCAC